jgi:MFS transporter, ceroid-lipofuscinosis neuronal protein 7
LENNNANIPEDGIQDVTSFWIVCLVLFVGGMVQGIFFPTMLALCQKLKGDQVLLGYVTSSFSIGRFFMLPMFGSWSTTKGYKWTLSLSTGVILIGSIMMTQVLRVGQQWFLVLSNTILGVGSGTLAVARAYTSEVTCTDERTGYMALISAVQYSGMTVTPLFGSLFTYIRELYHEDEDETTR